MSNPSRNSLQTDDQALTVHNRGRSLLHFASFCHSGKCIVKDRGLTSREKKVKHGRLPPQFTWLAPAIHRRCRIASVLSAVSK